MIVVNTTVLSNLAIANRLELLPNLYGEILVPFPVYQEILQGVEAGYEFLTRAAQFVQKGQAIHVEVPRRPSEWRLFRKLRSFLGDGEAAGIALAKSRGVLFLSDDRRARLLAAEHSVAVSGTLGVLKTAVDLDQLSIAEADAALQAMIRLGYRSPIQSLQELERQ